MTATGLRTLRLGTRASLLARTQAGLVADSLVAQGLSVELVEVSTQGDTDQRSLAQIGGTGVFAAALRQAVLDGRVDLAVHSLKDLPAVQPEGLVVAAVPRREDPRDVLVGSTLADLRPGATVGTGSPRRAAQLAALRPDLDIVDVRGNVDTRVAAALSGRLDAVVLARAGLARLGRLDVVAEVLDLLPAPGQGALAVECLPGLAETFAALDDPETRLAVTAERAVLAGLGAGCATPVAALAEVADGLLQVRAIVGAGIRVEEQRRVRDRHETGRLGSAEISEAERLGRDVAAALLAQGAGEYLTNDRRMGRQ